MTLVKCLLNAVVSEDAHFGTLDITGYCLGADVPEDDTQSPKMHLDDYPSSLLYELGLSDFLQNDRAGKAFVHANIVKTVPGFKIPVFCPRTVLSATSPPAGITKPPLPRCSAITPVASPSRS